MAFVFRLLSCLSLFGTLPFLLSHRIRIPPALISVGYQQMWETPPVDSQFANTVLSQKWTYLARGNQAYVFESQDGQYVLKLFRYRFSKFAFVHACTNAYHVNLCGQKPKDSFAVKIRKTALAAKIAATEAKDFSQVLFCHLNLTQETLPIVKIEIPSGTYSVRLDRLRFVIQKKVTPFAKALLAARQDPIKIRAMVQSFVSLLKERSQLGILNSDPNVFPNYGFLDTRAVEMDFGNYRQSNDPQKQKEELHRRVSCCLDWFYLNAPEYVNYIFELKIDL